jgi:hypothetical protein
MVLLKPESVAAPYADEIRRIHIPRTRVNKGKKKDRVSFWRGEFADARSE